MVGSLGPSAAVVGALGVAGAVTALVLAVQRPPVTEGTVLAAAPWMVVGALMEALAATGAYGFALALFDPPQVHLAALVLGGLVWAPLVQGAVVRERLAAAPRHLAAAGGGAVLVLAGVLFWRAPPTAAGAFWLVVAPVVAVLLAAVAYFLLGLADATPLVYTRLAGLLAVFAHALDGVATAVAIDVFGRAPRGVAAFVADASGTLPVDGVGPLVLPLRVAGALLAVLVLGHYARGTETRAYLALGVLAALGLGPGAATLLVVAVG